MNAHKALQQIAAALAGDEQTHVSRALLALKDVLHLADVSEELKTKLAEIVISDFEVLEPSFSPVVEADQRFAPTADGMIYATNPITKKMEQCRIISVKVGGANSLLILKSQSGEFTASMNQIALASRKKALDIVHGMDKKEFTWASDGLPATSK